MDSPNQKATRFLKLKYLDPSQSQPEVKINEAWDILDEAIENGLPINTGGASDNVSGGGSGGGAISIEDLNDSPPQTFAAVELLRVEGPLVTLHQQTDLSVLMDIDFQPIADQAILGNISGGALKPYAVQLPEAMQSAGWNSVGAPIAIAYAVAQDLLIAYPGTLREVVILTQGGNGSCTVKLWKANLSAHFPPVAGDDITGGTNPQITAEQTYQDTTLAGWAKSFAKDDVIRCTLSASSIFTSVKIFLRIY